MSRPRFGQSFVTALLRQGADVPVLPIVDGTTSDGTVSVDPAVGTAGEWGTWTVTYTVGQEAVRELGGLRVQLPEAWHAGIRNSAFRMQASSPREPNFVSGASSRPDVILQAVVELETDAAFDKVSRLGNLSGLAGYYDYVSRVIVRRGELTTGDTLALVFGDTTGGSRGFRAGIQRVADAPVLVAIDHGGGGRFRLHEQRPGLTIRPGAPAELLATAPTDAVVGAPFTLRIALVDEHANAVDAPADVDLEVVEGRADVPERVHVPAGRGWAEVACIPRAEGWLRVRARDPGTRLEATGNPTRVHATEPATRIFWGDLHSHTEVGADGVGTGREAYDYARNVSGLDFLSRTDHSEYFEDGNAIADFADYVKLADERNEPGAFVTLHGYEASFAEPYGHHNVYFRGRPGPLLNTQQVTLPQLWKALDGVEALTIPHHTMKMPAVVDWTGTHDERTRRNFEIYSAHGLSEEFDPYHPLAMEQSLFTNPSTTSRRGTSAQRAWEDGLVLSTIASSDDHRAHPGQPHFGVVAVRAGALTRADVFDALHDRRTYATTGSRIVLDVSVAGVQMGGRGVALGPVEIHCAARGTDVVDLVEVLRHAGGQPGFRVIASLRPFEEMVAWSISDDPPPGAAIYYVRLRQRTPVRGRVPMAWSSPVWLEVRGGG